MEMKSIDKRVNVFTKGGEKAGVERMVRECVRDFDVIGRELINPRSGKERREERLNGLKPVIETKSMKRSGLALQVPTAVRDQRGVHRVCNWIRESTLKRAEKIGGSLKDARRMERIALYEEYSQLSVSSNEVNRQSYGNYHTIPMQIRDRRHRAAKANRVFASSR